MKAGSIQIFGKVNMVLGGIVMVLDLSLKMAHFPIPHVLNPVIISLITLFSKIFLMPLFSNYDTLLPCLLGL
jgi:hypothetical protein